MPGATRSSSTCRAAGRRRPRSARRWPACHQRLQLSPAPARPARVRRGGRLARDDGRERAWRATSTGWWSDVDPEADPSGVQALDSVITRVMMASSDEKLLAFVDHATREPQWREAALFSNSTLVATPAELAAISAAVLALLRPYLLSDRPADEVPEDARRQFSWGNNTTPSATSPTNGKRGLTSGFLPVTGGLPFPVEPRAILRRSIPDTWVNSSFRTHR